MTQVRMKRSIQGSYYGIKAEHIFSVEFGDIIELAEPAWVLHELKNDRVELTLTGPIGRGAGANVKDVAAMEKIVAAEAARRSEAMPPVCDCGCGQVLRDSGPRGVVSKLKALAAG